jgi:hypothetical protein
MGKMARDISSCELRVASFKLKYKFEFKITQAKGKTADFE